jgi:spermidine synthase
MKKTTLIPLVIVGLAIAANVGLRMRKADLGDLVDTVETPLNTIFVYDDGDVVSFQFDALKKHRSVQSQVRKSAPDELLSSYQHCAVTGMSYANAHGSMMNIGLGGGRLPHHLSQKMPEMLIDAVEIDQGVYDVAQKYFYFQPTDRLRVTIDDGRKHLMQNADTYDVLLVDAYRGSAVPFHLTTREFYELAESRINEGGVLLQNVHKLATLRAPMLETLTEVFDHVESLDCGYNTILVAYNGAVKTSEAVATRTASFTTAHGLTTPTDEALTSRAVYVAKGEHEVLTDDFAPVNALTAFDTNNRDTRQEHWSFGWLYDFIFTVTQ